MDNYLADRSDQIVDTAIRCCIKLSKDDVVTEASQIFLESRKEKEQDASLRDKIIRAIDKTADAIENHGDAVKNNAKASTKQIKSMKNVPNEKVEIKDRQRLKTNARNAQKQIKKAVDNGDDKSAIDKIMDTYRNHKKEIFTTIGVCVVVVPALISGVIDGFKSAVDSTSQDAAEFSRNLAKKVKNNEVNPKMASAANAAYTTVSRDIIAAEEAECSEAMQAVRNVTARGVKP